MDALQKQVRRAWRRMMLQRFAIALTWSMFGAFCLAAVAIAIPKVWPLPLRGDIWSISWLAGGFAFALIVAGLWTYFTRHGVLDAAIEIDRRFELKERVSSALALDMDERESEAGRALVADATRRIDRLDVDERFKLTLSRKAMLPLLPAAIAAALVLLVSDQRIESVNATTSTAAELKQIQQPVKNLTKQIEDKKAEAKELGLEDAANLFKKVEEGTKELAAKKEGDRKDALIRLNDLAKEMEKRRQELGGDEKLKEQLKNLKNMSAGPADKMAEALKNGDLRKAIEEVEKLKDQLSKGELSEEKKQELAKQLDEMQKKINEIADAHKQQQENLKKQIEEMKKSGQNAEAQKLQDQLDKMQAQNDKMQQMQNLASKLGQAAEGMKNGQPGEASQALDDLQSDLAQMQKENSEIEMINDALQQMAAARDAMNCQACQGEGCGECQGGMGQKPGQGQGKGKGQGDGQGDGLGEGRGAGARPEEKVETKTRDTIARQKVGKGGAVVVGEVEGPNSKGEVQQRIREAMEAGVRESEDPLNNQRLPRNQRDHVQEYFDTIRGG